MTPTSEVKCINCGQSLTLRRPDTDDPTPKPGLRGYCPRCDFAGLDAQSSPARPPWIEAPQSATDEAADVRVQRIVAARLATIAATLRAGDDKTLARIADALETAAPIATGPAFPGGFEHGDVRVHSEPKATLGGHAPLWLALERHGLATGPVAPVAGELIATTHPAASLGMRGDRGLTVLTSARRGGKVVTLILPSGMVRIDPVGPPPPRVPEPVIRVHA